jgi:hypothetical protein
VNGTRANWEPGSTLLMGRYPLVCRVTETQTDGSYSLVEQTRPTTSSRSSWSGQSGSTWMARSSLPGLASSC